MKLNNINTQKTAMLALLTAIVIILQIMATILPVYPFTLTLVLIPIVVGASLLGVYAGAWLGFVFGMVVLISGQAGLFLAWNAPATVLVVLVKGSLAGMAAGFAYKLISEKSRLAAVITASILCPLLNTGVFVLGTYLFFMPYIIGWGAGIGFESAAAAIFLGFIGINFPIEFVINLVLSPAILRLVHYSRTRMH